MIRSAPLRNSVATTNQDFVVAVVCQIASSPPRGQLKSIGSICAKQMAREASFRWRDLETPTGLRGFPTNGNLSVEVLQQIHPPSSRSRVRSPEPQVSKY